MDSKVEEKLDALKLSVDVLILVELCKRGASRDDARAVFGTLDNNLFAKVNKIINQKKQEKNGHKTKSK